ncbi:MAG: hypothetical protein ACM3UR_09170 [Bacteroidota bacterium]
MPIKAILIILCALSLPKNLFAQKSYFVRAKATYNFFAANDLKAAQQDMQRNLRGVGAETLESFPPYFGMQFQFLMPVKDSSEVNAGLYFEQFSTGGRIHYEDYSGEIGFDQILSSNAFGIMIEKNYKSKRRLNLSLNLGVSLIWTSYTLKTYGRIFDQKESESVTYDGITIGFTPGITLFREISNFTILGSVGYQICLPSTFKYNGATVRVTIFENTISPGIYGLRLGFGLGYKI